MSKTQMSFWDSRERSRIVFLRNGTGSSGTGNVPQERGMFLRRGKFLANWGSPKVSLRFPLGLFWAGWIIRTG